MKITSDYHIHSNNSCDGACASITDLIKEAAQKGIKDFGVTDHIHTQFNLSDLAASRQEYMKNNPDPNFHFGVEVSCVSQWEVDMIAQGKHEGSPVYGIRKGGPAGGPLAIGINKDDIKHYQIEYVIGGAHWPNYTELERMAIIKSYHQQNMFIATHPLIDIVAHPWWWMGYWRDENQMYTTKPWLDDFKVIPKSMHSEFAAAVLEEDKLVEINLNAMLLSAFYSDKFKHQYLEYLANLKDMGVKLTIGSDFHRERYLDVDFKTAETMLDSVDISEDDLYSPVCI